MNLCIHFASLKQYNTILCLNSIPPSLLTTLSPFPNCHLITHTPTSLTIPPNYSPTLPSLSPRSAHTRFPPCCFTPVIYLSDLPGSRLSHLSQLTSLPTTNRHLQNSNLLSLSRQGKHMWLIVRRPLMKAGWWGFTISKIENLLPQETIMDRQTGVCLAAQ